LGLLSEEASFSLAGPSGMRDDAGCMRMPREKGEKVLEFVGFSKTFAEESS
jgi:hypothetical protein